MFFNKYCDTSVTSHDADKVIFSFLSQILTDHKNSPLSKGQNFAIPLKDINYANNLLLFELLYGDIDS